MRIEEYTYIDLAYYKLWLNSICKNYDLVHIFPASKQEQSEGNFYNQSVLIHIFKKKGVKHGGK